MPTPFETVAEQLHTTAKKSHTEASGKIADCMKGGAEGLATMDTILRELKTSLRSVAGTLAGTDRQTYDTLVQEARDHHTTTRKGYLSSTLRILDIDEDSLDADAEQTLARYVSIKRILGHMDYVRNNATTKKILSDTPATEEDDGPSDPESIHD